MINFFSLDIEYKFINVVDVIFPHLLIDLTAGWTLLTFESKVNE